MGEFLSSLSLTPTQFGASLVVFIFLVVWAGYREVTRFWRD